MTQKVTPLALGGMFSAGDPSAIPDEHTVLMKNMLIRPGPRFDARPPATYDSLMTAQGLLQWEDLKDQQTRFLALDATKLYQKATSGETWDAGTATVTGTRMVDYANYRGKVYVMMDDGAGSPSAAMVWDGTTLSSAPFNSTINGRCIAAFNDRLFIGYPRVTITNLVGFITGYDWTGPIGWVATSASASNVTVATGATVCRISPTSTAAVCSMLFLKAGPLSIVNASASSSEQNFIWRSDIRGVDPTYRVPITLDWILFRVKGDTTAYAVGDIVTSPSTPASALPTAQRYRCTVAGTP